MAAVYTRVSTPLPRRGARDRREATTVEMDLVAVSLRSDPGTSGAGGESLSRKRSRHMRRNVLILAERYVGNYWQSRFRVAAHAWRKQWTRC